MGPIGLWVYANHFLGAAKALPEPTVRFEPVRYYLICHSIELSLKAFLSLKGATMVELSDPDYGHKLQKILTDANKKSLQSTVSLSAEQLTEISKAEYYYKGKVFEYPAVGEAINSYPELPDSEILFSAATRLVESLEKLCKQ
jgi:hypothetical protein